MVGIIKKKDVIRSVDGRKGRRSGTLNSLAWVKGSAHSKSWHTGHSTRVHQGNVEGEFRCRRMDRAGSRSLAPLPPSPHSRRSNAPGFFPAHHPGFLARSSPGGIRRENSYLVLCPCPLRALCARSPEAPTLPRAADVFGRASMPAPNTYAQQRGWGLEKASMHLTPIPASEEVNRC